MSPNDANEARREPAPARTGVVIGEKYRIERKIGEGGIGAVYEAVHTWTGRRVALKMLIGPAAGSDAQSARFIQEARAAAGLTHPNIVEIVDLGRDAQEGALFLVQELLTGEDLDQRLARGGALPLDELFLIAVPVLEALAFAHAHGVAHRDIKPANIFLASTPGGDRVPKIIDFGASKLLGEIAPARITGAGHAVGTPEYMSPEQLRGGGLAADADVWSVGVVLFEALTGHLPFKAASVHALVARIVTERAPSLRTLLPTALTPVATVIDRALSPEVADRYPSAQALLDALLDAAPEVAERIVRVGTGRFRLADGIPRRASGSMPAVPAAIRASAPVPRAHDEDASGQGALEVTQARRALRRRVRMGLVPAPGGARDDGMLRQLEAALGPAWRLARYGSYAALVDAVRDGEVDLAWLPPVAYIRVSRSASVHLLLAVQRAGVSAFASVLFTVAGSGITTLADLAGRHVAWVDAWSAAGYLVPRGMLRAAGLDPERIFASQTIAGSHAAVLDAVRTGLVDVGATYCSVDAQRRLLRAPWSHDAGLKAVACSEQIPADVICAAASVPLDEAHALAQRLVAIGEIPEGAALVAQVFGADGFTRVDAAQYALLARVLEADLPGTPRMRGPALALAVIALLACACSRPTELWVVVDSNIPVERVGGGAPMLRSVQIEARVAGAAAPFWNVPYDLRTGQYALPGHTVLRPSQGDDARGIRLHVTGTLADGTTVAQDALVSFAPSRRLLVRVFLARECVGARQLACEAMGRTCGEGGACIDVARSDLPEYGLDAAAPTDIARTDATPDVTADATPDSAAPFPACTSPAGVNGGTGVAPARLVWPPTASTATTRRPTFHWALPPGTTGGRVEVCAERGCNTVIAAFEADGTSVRPGCLLPTGTVFFRVRGRAGAAYSASTSPVWQVRLPRVVPSETIADTANGVDSDFDGDGFADVAVATVTAGASVLEVHRGRRGLPPDPVPQSVATAGVTYAGLVTIGDVNGDGFVDLAALAPAGDTVVVHYGSAAGITHNPTVVTGTFSEGFGTTVAGGDFDGDGFGDLLVGAPFAGPTAGSFKGRAVIFAGSPAGITTSPQRVIQGTVDSGYYGTTVAGSADANADGHSDFAVSAVGQPSGVHAGVVEVRSGQGTTADLGTLQGDMPEDRLGHALALADLNGDGYGDLLATSTTAHAPTERGAAYFQPGSATGVRTVPFSILSGASDRDRVGTSAAAAGDYNDDGFNDALVSEPGFTLGGPAVGRVFLVRGAPGSILMADEMHGDQTAGTHLEELFAPVGDVDGDGRPDLVFVQLTAAGTREVLVFMNGAFGTPFPAPLRTIAAGDTLNALAHAQ